MNNFMAKGAELTHTILRVGAGLFFWFHGAQKLFGWFGGAGPDGGTVELMSLYGLAGILEFFGGIAIMLGLFTRPVAFILAGEMAAAYFMAHLPRGLWPVENQGEPAALFALIFLFFAANGGGAFSLDAALRGRPGTLRVADSDERVRETARRAA